LVLNLNYSAKTPTYFLTFSLSISPYYYSSFSLTLTLYLTTQKTKE